jgi:hypothetical protein
VELGNVPSEAAIADQLLVQGDRAYVTGLLGSLEVMDVADPSAPSLLGSTLLDEQITSIAVSSRLAFVTQAEEISFDAKDQVSVVDLSDESAPELIMTVPLSTAGQDVAESDGILYVAADSGGLLTFRLDAACR